jgi:hypothetical protein
MDEERARIEKIVAVQIVPLVSSGPCLVATRNWIGRRGNGQNIENDSLAITLPAIVEKTAFWFPSLRKGDFAILCPTPIHAAIQRVCKYPNLTLVLRTIAKIGTRGEYSGKQ